MAGLIHPITLGGHDPFNIKRAFTMKFQRQWHTLYVAVDLHGTLILPYHDKIEFYPDAIEVMQWFNRRSDFKVILWTSSYLTEIAKFDRVAKKKGIRFDFINGNPLEANSKLAFFGQKFYFNILLDDKSSFDGEYDWTFLAKVLEDTTGEKILKWNKEQIARLNKGIRLKIKGLKSYYS